MSKQIPDRGKTSWEEFTGRIAFRVFGKPVHTFVLVGVVLITLAFLIFA